MALALPIGAIPEDEDLLNVATWEEKGRLSGKDLELITINYYYCCYDDCYYYYCYCYYYEI